MKNVLVFIEGEEGKITEDSKNIVKDGRKLANLLGGSLIGAAYSETISREELTQAAIDEFWELPFTKDDDPCGQLAGSGIGNIVGSAKLGLLLAANNLLGETILAIAAASSGGVFFHSCRQITIEAGDFKIHQSTYAGKVDEVRILPGHSNVCFATLIPSGTGRSPYIEKNNPVTVQTVDPLVNGIVPKIIETFKAKAENIDLTEAEVVVAMGDGIANEKGLKLVSQFASLIGATLGGSRIVVDNGFLPHNRLIGLTGNVVAPRLYVGVGVSGAPHHLIGIKESDVIVGINSDPNAPLLKVADLAIIGDALEILPALIDRLGGDQVV
ncbi:electron transfer flavoprotein subunit alpha/FixB family protein [Bacillus sp. AFS031507]|uniref:electron transfer flavoprotein subunit alpha/FixB family protein n=1 Tax=Bacillus sp. AFS031507 TaxID=2033496 RepID=UPI0015D4F55E|nr:electron transfer flavoprotein subunit alpha/FixB family protein [Bacillus sp. AFS031507]